jgi:hypothetical protein
MATQAELKHKTASATAPRTTETPAPSDRDARSQQPSYVEGLLECLPGTGEQEREEAPLHPLHGNEKTGGLRQTPSEGQRPQSLGLQNNKKPKETVEKQLTPLHSAPLFTALTFVLLDTHQGRGHPTWGRRAQLEA